MTVGTAVFLNGDIHSLASCVSFLQGRLQVNTRVLRALMLYYVLTF